MPEATAVASPELLTVATEELLELHAGLDPSMVNPLASLTTAVNSFVAPGAKPLAEDGETITTLGT